MGATKPYCGITGMWERVCVCVTGKCWLRYEQRKGMTKSKAGKKENTGKEVSSRSPRHCSSGAGLYVLAHNIVMRSSERL